MNPSILRASERLYCALLRLYPPRYRQEYGVEMQFVFTEWLHEACARRGTRGLARVWGQTIRDAGASLLAEHVANLQETNMHKTNQIQPLISARGLLRVALATGALLLLLWLAMQSTGSMAWSGFDFALAGGMVFGIGLVLDVLLRRGLSPYRAGLALALGGAALMVAINGAVGLIGSEDNAANLLYYGVLGVGLAGALLARLRAAGMARALFATALAQVLVAAAALGLAGWDRAWLANLFFVGVWLAAGWLFQRAALERPAQPA